MWTIDIDAKVHEVYGQKKVYLRSDSACYNKEVVEICEKEGWAFSITADQACPLMNMIETLPENAWQRDDEDDTVEYAEVMYQPVGWPKEYRYVIKRKREKNQDRPAFVL